MAKADVHKPLGIVLTRWYLPAERSPTLFSSSAATAVLSVIASSRFTLDAIAMLPDPLSIIGLPSVTTDLLLGIPKSPVISDAVFLAPVNY